MFYFLHVCMNFLIIYFLKSLQKKPSCSYSVLLKNWVNRIRLILCLQASEILCSAFSKHNFCFCFSTTYNIFRYIFISFTSNLKYLSQFLCISFLSQLICFNCISYKFSKIGAFIIFNAILNTLIHILNDRSSGRVWLSVFWRCILRYLKKKFFSFRNWLMFHIGTSMFEKERHVSVQLMISF